MQGIKKSWQGYKKLFKEAFKDLKTKGRRHRQIPNLLTATRLIAAPFFIIPAAIAGNVPLIVIFTALFSLTDALDGFIARKYNLISELGKDLDATCDKVFAGSLLIAASFFNPVLLFNLAFEAVIALINIHGKLANQEVRTLYVGKIKTCVLYPLLGASFLTEYVNVAGLFDTLFIATTSMQMLTITAYLLKYDGIRREDREAIEEHQTSEVQLEDATTEEKDHTLVKTKEADGIDTYRELRDLLTHEAEINKVEVAKKEHQKVVKK